MICGMLKKSGGGELTARAEKKCRVAPWSGRPGVLLFVQARKLVKELLDVLALFCQPLE